jgi:hypothetical protein
MRPHGSAERAALIEGPAAELRFPQLLHNSCAEGQLFVQKVLIKKDLNYILPRIRIAAHPYTGRLQGRGIDYTWKRFLPIFLKGEFSTVILSNQKSLPCDLSNYSIPAF